MPKPTLRFYPEKSIRHARLYHKPLPMNRTSHKQFRLVGATAETAINSLDKVGWEAVAELSNVGAIDLDVVAEDDVHDLVVKEEEVLGDLGSARVLRVQCSNEGRTFACMTTRVSGCSRE